jgi:DNA polymerase elongation subunit (family B)
MAEPLILDLDTIKSYAWHLKVMGAYVQQPVPSIVGLDKSSIISSNDAAALYPTSIIYSNIGFDTIRHRVYDPFIVSNIINLLENVFKNKKENPTVIQSAVFGFKNALDSILKDYFKNKSVQNKKEAREFTLEYYPMLLNKLLKYSGNLQDIFEPKNDHTYYLLKSCLYPILETITWLNPQNRGYNQMLVEYVFFHDDFVKKPRDIYIFIDINSTKTKFKKLSFDEGLTLFKNYIVNPYGILFDKHKDNLAYDVELLMEALSKRRVVKNQMLVLYSLVEHWDKLSKETLEYIYSLEEGETISFEMADKILDEIHDTENREKRIKSLSEVEWFFKGLKMEPKDFAKLRASQLNIVQLGIKVAANSAYGIFGLITWPFASPLIGNAITNAGKIYGIKLFQAVTVDILEQKEKLTET